MIYWYVRQITQYSRKFFKQTTSALISMFWGFSIHLTLNIGHTVEWLNIGVQFRRYIINFMRSTTVATSFINVIEIIDSRISDFKVYYYLIYANLQTLKAPN